MSSLYLECDSEKRDHSEHLDLEVLYVQVVIEIMALIMWNCEGNQFGVWCQKDKNYP